MILSATIILVIALVGGFLPLLLRRSERQLHTALALSTGIFLGAVFLHLLPSLANFDDSQASHAHPDEAAAVVDDGHVHGPAAEDDGHEHDAAEDGHEHGPEDDGHEAETDVHAQDSELTDEHEREGAPIAALDELHHQGGHAHANTWLWFCVLLGVLGVYLIEALVLRTHDHGDLHRHRSVGYATLLGISIHALTTGFSMGAIGSNAELQGVILVAVLGHKGFEAFSLTTVFQLAEFSKATIVKLVIGFALVTPVGMLLGEAVAGSLSATGVGVATALATGTFLF
ncbi:MAG: zinc transporter ZupT, partial [Planctomycetota bacterium]